MHPQSPLGTSVFSTTLKQGIWVVCILACLFGAAERSTAALSDHCLSGTDLLQIAAAVFFLLIWLMMKPASRLSTAAIES
jgi:hypothetical protein